MIWLTVLGTMALPALPQADAADDVRIGAMVYIDVDEGGDGPEIGDIPLTDAVFDFFVASSATGPWTQAATPPSYTTRATRLLNRGDLLDLARVDPTGWLADEGDHIAACLDPSAAFRFSYSSQATTLPDPAGNGRDCVRYEIQPADTGYSFAFAVELNVAVDVGVLAFVDDNRNGFANTGDFAVPGIDFDLYEAASPAGPWTQATSPPSHVTTSGARFTRDDIRNLDNLDPSGWIAEEGDNIAICMNPDSLYFFDAFEDTIPLVDPTAAGRPCTQVEIAPNTLSFGFAVAVETEVIIDAGIVSYVDLNANGIANSGDMAIADVEFDLYEAPTAAGPWTQAVSPPSFITTAAGTLNRTDVQDIDTIAPTGWIVEEGDHLAICMNPQPNVEYDAAAGLASLADPTGAGRPCLQSQVAVGARGLSFAVPVQDEVMIDVGILAFLDLDNTGGPSNISDIAVPEIEFELYEAPSTSGPWTPVTNPSTHITTATGTFNRNDIRGIDFLDPSGWIVQEGDNIAVCMNPKPDFNFDYLASASQLLVDPSGQGRSCSSVEIAVNARSFGFVFALHQDAVLDVGVVSFVDATNSGGLPDSGDIAVPGITFDFYEAASPAGPWAAVLAPSSHTTTAIGTLNRDDVRDLHTVDPTGWIVGEGDNIAACMNTVDDYDFDYVASLTEPFTDPTGQGRPCTSFVVTSNLFGFSFAFAVTSVMPPAPTFSQLFAPTRAEIGTPATVTFIINNSASPIAVTDLAFANTLPAELVVATPNEATGTCGGTTTASGSQIDFVGGSAAAGVQCTISVDVVGTQEGTHVNETGDLTSSLGNSGPSTTSLVVVAVPPTATATSTITPTPTATVGVPTVTATVVEATPTATATATPTATATTAPTATTTATPVATTADITATTTPTATATANVTATPTPSAVPPSATATPNPTATPTPTPTSTVPLEVDVASTPTLTSTPAAATAVATSAPTASTPIPASQSVSTIVVEPEPTSLPITGPLVSGPITYEINGSNIVLVLPPELTVWIEPDTNIRASYGSSTYVGLVPVDRRITLEISHLAPIATFAATLVTTAPFSEEVTVEVEPSAQGESADASECHLLQGHTCIAMTPALAPNQRSRQFTPRQPRVRS